MPQTVEFQRIAQILAKAVNFIVSVSARLTLSQYFLQCGPVQTRKLKFQTCFNTPDVISRPRISTSFSRNSIARLLQLCTTDYITNCPKIRWWSTLFLGLIVKYIWWFWSKFVWRNVAFSERNLEKARKLANFTITYTTFHVTHDKTKPRQIGILNPRIWFYFFSSSTVTMTSY